jgi:hypothetical protein
MERRPVPCINTIAQQWPAALLYSAYGLSKQEMQQQALWPSFHYFNGAIHPLINFQTTFHTKQMLCDLIPTHNEIKTLTNLYVLVNRQTSYSSPFTCSNRTSRLLSELSFTQKAFHTHILENVERSLNLQFVHKIENSFCLFTPHPV